MKVFVQGLWHCGCVVSACLASLKHDVIAYDDNKKILLEMFSSIAAIVKIDPRIGPMQGVQPNPKAAPTNIGKTK